MCILGIPEENCEKDLLWHHDFDAFSTKEVNSRVSSRHMYTISHCTLSGCFNLNYFVNYIVIK